MKRMSLEYWIMKYIFIIIHYVTQCDFFCICLFDKHTLMLKLFALSFYQSIYIYIINNYYSLVMNDKKEN